MIIECGVPAKIANEILQQAQSIFLNVPAKTNNVKLQKAIEINDCALQPTY